MAVIPLGLLETANTILVALSIYEPGRVVKWDTSLVQPDLSIVGLDAVAKPACILSPSRSELRPRSMPEPGTGGTARIVIRDYYPQTLGPESNRITIQDWIAAYEEHQRQLREALVPSALQSTAGVIVVVEMGDPTTINLQSTVLVFAQQSFAVTRRER